MSDEIVSDVPGMARGESKARKALSKLGLKKLDGINRVVLKRAKNSLYIIAAPEVFKSPHSECYIVFGEAAVVDGNAGGAFGSNAQLQQAEAMAEAKLAAEARQSAGKASAQEDDIEEGDVDETGLSTEDIETIMSQASCSRAKAVNALRSNNNDLIASIMSI